MRSLYIHSRDATETHADGGHVFDVSDAMEGGSRVASLSVSSAELPASQYTIESGTNRIFFHEGVRLCPGYRSLVFEECSHRCGCVHRRELSLPLHLNRVVSVSVDGESVIIETQHPHGLGHTSATTSPTWWICSPLSPTGETHPLGSVVPVSDRSIRVELGGGISDGVDCTQGGGDFGYLHHPLVGGPEEWASTLEEALRESKGESPLSYAVSVDPVEGRFRVTCVGQPHSCCDVSKGYSVQVSGDELALAWGLRESKGVAPYSTVRSLRIMVDGQCGGADDGQGAVADVRFELSSAPMLAGWGLVRVPPGWYSPTSRPLVACQHQSRHLADELTRRWNALYFSRPCALRFVDHTGKCVAIEVHRGTYSSGSFCDHVAGLMCEAGSPGGIYAVSYDCHRFEFRCHTRTTGPGCGEFALIFDSTEEDAIDPERLGFVRTRYSGNEAYRSETPVTVPYLDEGRNPGLQYHVAELSDQGRFRFGAMRKPAMSATAWSISTTDGLLELQTTVEGDDSQPVAHGYDCDDVLSLEIIRCDDADAVGSSWKGSAVVHPGSRCGVQDLAIEIPRGAFEFLQMSTSTFRFRVRSTTTATQSVHFAASAGAIEPSRLGLTGGGGARLMQWKVGHPLIADSPYQLDQPDYLLLFVDPGARMTGTLRGARGDQPLAKITVNPQIREGAARCEATSTVDVRLGRLTIQIRNPDGTPYRLHGAPFSITFSMICRE